MTNGKKSKTAKIEICANKILLWLHASKNITEQYIIALKFKGLEYKLLCLNEDIAFYSHVNYVSSLEFTIHYTSPSIAQIYIPDETQNDFYSLEGQI